MGCEHADKIDCIPADQQSEYDPCVENTAREISLDEQPVKAGGSGAGCSAAVLCAHILPQLAAGRWRRVLFVATGALMSQATFLQGQTIPGIAHAVELAAPAGEGKA